MGVSRGGRFAAVTNFRGATEARAAESRGVLPVRFLEGGERPDVYLKKIKADQYSGFNLLVCDGEELWSMSNRDGPPRRLEPGVYGLGNTLLDAPEVDEPKKRFAAELAAIEPLFSVLEKSKIVNARYGTRCSTILIRHGKQVRYAERSFSPDGEAQDTVRYEF
jgi:uncharacterized protein with NRDE domain